MKPAWAGPAPIKALRRGHLLPRPEQGDVLPGSGGAHLDLMMARCVLQAAKA